MATKIRGNTQIIAGSITPIELSDPINALLSSLPRMIAEDGIDGDNLAASASIDTSNIAYLNKANSFTLNQTLIALSTATAGSLFKGLNRFLHNYADPATDGNNTFLGVNSGNFTMGAGGVPATIGSYNVAVGMNALLANTTGSNNVAVGYNVLSANTTGSSNTAFGSSTLVANTTGVNNVAVGQGSLSANTTSSGNVAIGRNALSANTIGDTNSAIGFQALLVNTTGTNNVAVGVNALSANTTADGNVAVGASALSANTIGFRNVAVGGTALSANTIGSNNVASGAYGLANNTTGSENSATGVSALYANTTGGANSAVGFQAGYGVGVNSNTTGTNNVFIGDRTVGATNADTNSIVIGSGAIGIGNNTVVLGNTSILTTRLQGNVGIGTNSPQATLDFQGSLRGITVAKSAAYTLTTADNTVYVTTGVGGVTITLPAASANTIGLFWFVLKIDAGVGLLTIAPTGTNNLNGVNANKTIANQWNGVLIRGVSNTDWLITSFTGL